MISSLTIDFYGEHRFVFKRVDSMRLMDLGDDPEHLQLRITMPTDAPGTISNPIFGSRSSYTGHLSNGGEFRPVFVKWASSRARVKELKKEGGFYCSALRELQDVVVPKFHGCFTASKTEFLGMGCMILEQLDENPGIDNRMKLEAAYRLHKFGIRHSGLGEARNFVAKGDKVYIIKFSGASTRCGCEMAWDRVRLCPELKEMERKFGHGEASAVLKEIGVPDGWRMCLYEPTRMPEESQMSPNSRNRAGKQKEQRSGCLRSEKTGNKKRTNYERPLSSK